MRTRDSDRLRERQPKLKTVNAGHGDGRSGEFKLGLYTVPELGQRISIRRVAQAHDHGARPVRWVDQYRWLHVGFPDPGSGSYQRLSSDWNRVMVAGAGGKDNLLCFQSR